jgi:transposase
VAAVIDPSIRATIRRLHYAEHWKVGTIAGELKLPWRTVEGALSDKPTAKRAPRKSVTDAWEDFVRDVLDRHPRLRATRIYEMLRTRGYGGKVVPVRRLVRRLRPRWKEAFFKLSVLPGEQGQVDWADFGSVTVGRAQRRLSAFVLTLSWSRAFSFSFFYDQTLESFLCGHVSAFSDVGVPRVLLYDNLRSVVLSRHGDLVQFHPRLLELSAHYHFEPRPVAVRRGNEKGRVERAIRYIRESFFAGRGFSTLERLNAEARLWRDEVAHQRRQFVDDAKTVAEALVEERARLLPLPVHPFDTDLSRPVHTQKTPYVRFDRNDYSVPPSVIGKPLTLVASPFSVRLLDGTTEVARHSRSYDTGQRIEERAHLRELSDLKRKGRSTGPLDELVAEIPQAKSFLEKAHEAGEAPTSVLRQLLRLRGDYGALALRRAIRLALEHNTPRPSAVAYLLQKALRTQKAAPPLPVRIDARPDLLELSVTPADVEIYDELSRSDDE